MSYHVTHRIGGEMTRRRFYAVLKEAARLNLRSEATDVHVAALLRTDDDLATILDEERLSDGTVGFVRNEHDEPSIDAMEDVCLEQTVPYVSTAAADEEAGAQIRWWRPGMEGCGTCMGDADGDAVLKVDDVVRARREGTLEDLVAGSTVEKLDPVTLLN